MEDKGDTMRSLKDNLNGVVDLGVVLMIGVSFAALMVIAYIIWELEGDLVTTTTSAETNSSIYNITTGFDSAISLILVAITIFILAIAISALLMLRGR